MFSHNYGKTWGSRRKRGKNHYFWCVQLQRGWELVKEPSLSLSLFWREGEREDKIMTKTQTFSGWNISLNTSGQESLKNNLLLIISIAPWSLLKYSLNSRKVEIYSGNAVLGIRLLQLLMLMRTWNWYLIPPFLQTGNETQNIYMSQLYAANYSLNVSTLFSRLVCICASSGSIHLLKISWDTTGRVHRPTEFARLELQGEIFSSPVMIGGRIFVGCRDDYVHCIAVEAQSSLSN